MFPRLFLLFARTAARRFGNRFLLGWQKRAEARRRRQGLPEPDRTATAHRLQRFRPGNIVAALFSSFMIFALGAAMNQSFTQAMNLVRNAREPARQLTVEQRLQERMLQQLEDGTGPAGDQQNPEQRAAAASALRKMWNPAPLERMDPSTRRSADRVAALMMFIAGAGTLLLSIGLLSRHISRPEPSLAWLFEFPVPRAVLFTSKLGECLFDSAALPLLSLLPGIYLFHSGHSFWSSVAWGLSIGLFMSLAVAALRIAAEVLLLQKLPRRRRGTITGVCAAFGVLGTIIVLYGGGTPHFMRWLLSVADALPSWFFLNPFSAGFGSGISFTAQWWIHAVVALCLCAGAVLFCSSLTKYGLEPGLESVRNSQSLPVAAGRFPRGLVGKELLMLVRQRMVIVQVMLAPLIMVLMLYFQSSGRMADRVLGSDGAMASAIYGVCAYMVLIASQVAMNTELRTLWLLLSLPRPLADSLRVKSRIWAVAAVALALIMAATAVILRPEFASGFLFRLPFLLAFIALIADLSVGIRTMGSSIVSESTVHFRQWAAWLPLALSAAAGQAVFTGEVWVLCVQLVLLCALDVSVWQKLNAELPWLTEPAEDPPPRLFLMHGQLAVYGCFALQGLGLWLAFKIKLPPQTLYPVAVAFATLVVAILAFHLLHRARVRIMPPAKLPLSPSCGYAIAGLLVACAGGFTWLQFLKWNGSPAGGFTGGDTSTWLITLCSVAVITPVCEEFIFRGLVYQALRQAGTAPAAILWSSLLFTAVHPMQNSVPFFILAAVNAFIVERTKRLAPGIVIHAGYSALMLWLQSRG